MRVNGNSHNAVDKVTSGVSKYKWNPLLLWMIQASLLATHVIDYIVQIWLIWSEHHSSPLSCLVIFVCVQSYTIDMKEPVMASRLKLQFIWGVLCLSTHRQTDRQRHRHVNSILMKLWESMCSWVLDKLKPVGNSSQSNDQPPSLGLLYTWEGYQNWFITTLN